MPKIIVHSLSELPLAATEIISHLKDHTIIGVYGNLGSGKTTVIKEICRQLGVPEIVNSPTFALVNEYFTTRGGVIYHFDFFRINSIREAFDIGYEDFFYSGNICFIEWPEKVEELLTDYVLRIYIQELPGGEREISIGHPAFASKK